MIHRLFISPLAFVASWFLLPSAAPAADPHKLTHRPLPGLPRPSPAKAPAMTPRVTARATTAPSITAVMPERARIVFIHRRDKLPEALTKDLAPKEAAQARATPVEPPPARQGRIRIIPKAEVATLLSPASQSATSSDK